MKRTYKYKARISKRTEASALRWLNLCRRLYNGALAERINLYKESGRSLSAYDQDKELSQFKKDNPEFAVVGSQVLQDTLDRLDKAYKAFFRRLKERNGKAGFPRFKSEDRYDSFTLKQAGWKLNGRYLTIKNVGKFKLFLSRPIAGDIKTLTVIRSSSGWFVSFSCDNVPVKEYITPPRYEVGIDLGIKSFCVDSGGNETDNPKFLVKSLQELRIKQRALSRKKKGSNRRIKAKKQVAKVHSKISNQRKDFLHKLANFYIALYSVIYTEDLNIKGMVKNHHLAKSISDASWGMFFSMLSYKAEEAGRLVLKINPRNTSQICSNCGEIVPKKLSVRTHSCPHCGLIMDRDLNAAINIKRFGQNRQALSSQ